MTSATDFTLSADVTISGCSCTRILDSGSNAASHPYFSASPIVIQNQSCRTRLPSSTLRASNKVTTLPVRSTSDFSGPETVLNESPDSTNPMSRIQMMAKTGMTVRIADRLTPAGCHQASARNTAATSTGPTKSPIRRLDFPWSE